MNRVSILCAAALISGCAGIQQNTFTLSDGRTVDYIHGKIDADGQTGVFRDAYIDGQPVISHYGAGPSLWGQVLSGSGAAAVYSAGAMGAAALLRPDRHTDATSVEVEKAELQAFAPEEPIIHEPVANEPVNVTVINNNKNKSNSVSVSGSSASAKAKGGNVKVKNVIPSGGSNGGSCKHHCGSEQGPGDNIKKKK